MAGLRHQSAQATRSHGEQALRDLDLVGGMGERGKRQRVPMPHGLPEFMRPDEAAERYRFKSARLFSRFASRYRIPFEWFGGRKLYRTADLEAMRTPGQPLRRRMERAS